jgi:hypothetical protein
VKTKNAAMRRIFVCYFALPKPLLSVSGKYLIVNSKEDNDNLVSTRHWLVDK